MSQLREAGRGLRIVVFVALVSMLATVLSVVTPSPIGANVTVTDSVTPTVTVVIGTASRPSRPDRAILSRLDATGHPYVVVDDSDLTAQMADDADFVLLTDSVLRGRVRGDIEATSTPVASMKWGLFRDLGFLERGGRSGRVGGGKTITINDPSHPLAAGLSGEVEVLTRNVPIGYANIGSEGTMVAERGMVRRMRSTIFAYEEGEPLSNGAVAPGRRIGTFIANAVVTRLNSNGWALFDAMIDYGLGDVVVTPNQPPMVDDQSFDIDEDAAPGDSIGTVLASDPDNDSLTYSLDDESHFAINPTTGELTVVALDQNNSPHTATVTVTDPGNLSDTALITVTVNDVDEPPVVSILLPVTGDVFTEGDTVSFEGTAFDPDTGDDLSSSLVWSSDLDGPLTPGGATFDTTDLSVGTHVVTASVTESGGLTGSNTIEITINPAPNNPPTVTITDPASGDSSTEGDSIDFAATATDTEDGDLTAEIDWESDIDGSLATDSGSFSRSDLTVGTHTITASVTDGDGATGADSVEITIAANTPPTVNISDPFDGDSFLDTDTIAFSGSASDTEDGDLSAELDWESDLDGSLATDTSSFDAISLSVGTHMITASVTDSGGITGSETIEITVNSPVNEIPVVMIGSPTDGDSFTDGDDVMFAATANDVEDGTLTGSIDWDSDVDGSLAIDTGTFTIDSLTVGVHNITASVMDTDGAIGSQTIQITITAAPNNPPVVNDQAFDVDEDAAAGAVVGTVVASDPDAGDTLNYSLDDVSNFEIDVNDGEITVAGTANLVPNTDIVLTVTVADQDGAATDATITISVSDIPEDPVVDDQSFSVSETAATGDPVGMVVASDPDAGDTLTYSLDDVTDIEIDSATGDLTVAATANLVSGDVINLIVTVMDQTARSDTANIDVTVTDVNFAPVVNDQAFDVDEDAAAGDVVGTVVASDPDPGDTLNYSLDDVSNFEIDATTGEITVAGTANLVPNTDIVLTVTVADQLGAATDATITIAINDVNEAPVVEDQTFTISEDDGPGDPVGTVQASDPDVGDTLTFSLDDESLIEIDSANGDMQVAPGATLTPGDIVLTVTVEDGGSLTDTATITVTVTNVNDAPVVMITAPNDGDTFTVGDSVSFSGTANDAEDGVLTGDIDWDSSIDGSIATDTGSFSTSVLSLGTHVISASVTDSNGETTTASIEVIIAANAPPVVTITAPSNGDTFTVGDSVSFAGTATDPEDGDISASLTWRSSRDGALPSGPSFSTTTLSVGSHVVTADVTDSDGAPGSDTVIVNIEPLNRAPVVDDQGFNVAEDSAAGTVIGTVAATDPDLDSLTYSIDDNSEIDIDSTSGELTVVDIGARSVGDDITVTITVEDPDGLTDTALVTVGVGALSVGLDEVIDGEINPSGDTDTYEFTASAGTTILIDVLDLVSGDCNANFRLDLTAPSGAVLVNNGFVFNCASDFGPLELTESGEYTLVWSAASTETGSYQFEIVTVPADVPTPVDYDMPTTGEITVRGETDSFTFTGAVGDELFFDVLDLNGICDGNHRWTLIEPSGSTVFSDRFLFNCGSDEGPHTLDEAGTYTLVFDDPGDSLFTVEFEIVTVPADVPTPVVYNMPTNGEIAVRGETDSFTFTGAIGDDLLFDIQDIDSGDCSGNHRWTLTAPSGATVFNNAFIFNCGSDQSRVLAEAGTYTLVFDDPGDDVFNFTFEITEQP